MQTQGRLPVQYEAEMELDTETELFSDDESWI